MALLLSMAGTVSVKASDCVSENEIVAEKPGDYWESDAYNEPKLCITTGYYSENTHGSHGDRMHEGICAMAPEYYGSAVIIYEALKNDDGTFEIGDQLCIMECKDTGYGYKGYFECPSKIRPDKGTMGTIEGGIHIDAYYDDYAGCKKWMNRTQGYVFAQIIPNVKG